MLPAGIVTVMATTMAIILRIAAACQVLITGTTTGVMIVFIKRLSNLLRSRNDSTSKAKTKQGKECWGSKRGET